MSERDVIEGELAETSSKTEIVKQDDNTGAVVEYNPLDAEPIAFKRQLANRQENYDNLREHLFGVLVPGKDFGKIHVVKGCDNQYSCTNPYHLSGYELFAPGADKILGILSLAVHYPDLKDYKRACLQGHTIEEIIVDAQILGRNDHVMTVGVGACARSEIKGSNLNNTLKRACKRARVDAVKRLPTISALFEDNILEELAAAAKRNENNAARKRIHQEITKKWDTGARLEVCPIGRDIKGKKWRDIETNALQWVVANVKDKPDITRAASEELSKRNSAPGSSSIRTPSSPASDEQPPEYSDDDIPH